ncbi:MAG: hypothetical protein GTO45_23930 [Candidatus Aminicenantes bacterium]|nr:hypothetical protein [Candidatus Aminicenantes bacterium]NIM81807.1 hypothetical protein [Candidatus Aminicenantes bacterium]NIN21179.1 hypothetical protein [Candidatus Aminicenantes bacterium]NIN45003.1 hypothetical protein [Candidatus Aminicenantes bacterium]NIN87817.1 hypothetical protein [Candidatus Aminicenantes bacterium]
MNHKNTIYLDGEHLTIEDVINIAEKGYKVDFREGTKQDIADLRKRLDRQLDKHPGIKIYGTNVLHGDLKDKQVPLPTRRILFLWAVLECCIFKR